MNETLIRENFRLDNPSCEVEFFTARNGERYLVKSDKFYDNLDNSGVESYKANTYIMHEKDGELYTIARAKGSLNLNFGVAELDLISILSKNCARLGLGSKMLEYFEKSALNHGVKNIVGIFAPYILEIASPKDVEAFYKKNGYGFCKLPQSGIQECAMLFYKNFTFENTPKPPLDEDEYFGTEDYRKMLTPFKTQEQIDQICGLDEDLYSL